MKYAVVREIEGGTMIMGPNDMPGVVWGVFLFSCIFIYN